MPELYSFQRDAIANILNGKHLCIANVGSGKGSIALWVAHAHKKPRVLVVTTASKRDTHDSDGLNDFEAEADMWFPGWRASLSSFEVISWAGLSTWVAKNKHLLSLYTIIFDEIACAKAGSSSQRGQAFERITSLTDYWAGYTATPGDRWIDFQAYFVATKKVKNLTAFKREFCEIQTYKGFPEIVGYRWEKQLKEWWDEIAYVVDTSEMMREMPAEQHKVIHFNKPKYYDTTLKSRINTDTGRFIETTGEMCATLRRMCSQKKYVWTEEFIQNLGEQAVIFYNYTVEGNELEKRLKKVLPKTAKVWRIDGKHHEVPTPDNCGKQDVVLAQWQAGSMGLNLQFMRHWISFSPNYSWSISEQGRGRIKRIGQKRNMMFHYLKTDNTIEYDIYKCLKEKGEFSEQIFCINNGIDDLEVSKQFEDYKYS